MELNSEPIPQKYEPNDIQTKKILTKRGYCIIKKQYDSNTLANIRSTLTVKPNININYQPDSKYFPVYLEGPNKLYVPKFFGLDLFGPPSRNKLTSGLPVSLTFSGELRDNQKPIIKLFLDSCQIDNDISGDNKIDYNKSNGGIISVGCGWGKTVMGLYLAYKLGRKCLVIVHKDFLVNQWKERISQYLPNAQVGVIQGSRIDVEDKDIVIGMLQSISMKEYDLEIFEDFGFCIIDECHHIGAEVFSRSLSKINCCYMLGLSATPKRKDGLSKVFEWHLGPYIYRDKNKKKRKVGVRMIYYDSPDPLYNKVELTIRQKPSVPKMITNISLCTNRNLLITHLLIFICQDIKRKVLVLGERRDQLFQLKNLLSKLNYNNVGFYIGGMKEEELKKTERCQVMLATYCMSSEGMDIPALNTLFMISSKADIEQSVGRILRKEDPNNLPIVYDLVDNFSVFGNQGRKRLKFYQKNKYEICTSQARDVQKEMPELVQSAMTFTPLMKQTTQQSLIEEQDIKQGECLL